MYNYLLLMLLDNKAHAKDTIAFLYIILFSCTITHIYSAVNITNGGFVYKNSALIPEVSTHEISLTFSTKKHNGLLFYGNNMNSFFSMELYYGSVRISGNFSNQRTTMPYIGFAGYGLADGKPHQVEMYKRSQEIFVIIDRGTTKVSSYVVASSFLNNVINFDHVFIGNHPDLKTFNNFQSITKTNFVGCIEEATWNSLDLLSAAYAEYSVPECGQLDTNDPITFLNMDSFIMMYRDSKSDGLDLQFDLLIYQNISTIIKHQMNDTTFELVVLEGKLQMTLYIGTNIIINAITSNMIVSDGNWHNVKIFIPGKTSKTTNVVFAVDDFKIDSASPIFYNAGLNIQFGGYGFIGCINNIMLDTKMYTLEKQYKRKGISTSGCNITFQCNPNPCFNAGKCIALKNLEYSCLCNGNTTGLNCEKPLAPPTCTEIHKQNFRRDGPAIIDVDGVGPFDPIWVNCYHMNTFDSSRVVTVIKPEQNSYNLIDFPKSWEIKYNISNELLHLLAEHSSYCKQTVTYQCTKSRITLGNVTLMNWVGGDFKVHEYWNSFGIYGKCECSVNNNKCKNNQNCNCDNYDSISRVDRADLQFKSHLPVIRINAMNISSSLGSSAKIVVGDFFCQGIGGVIETVTFTEVFSYLTTDSLNLWNAGSFKLDFKTDQARGNIILYSRGRIGHDYILLYLQNPNTIAVEVNLGVNTHKSSVSLPSGFPFTLEDNKYYTIEFEISRRQFTLKLDGISSSIPLENNINAGILLNLDNLPTFLGGTPFDPFSGFRGTIRDFRINGQPQKIFQLAQNDSIIGVVPGSFSACIAVSNPCNSGRCLEHYNYYICDCSYSPYYGSHCQDERGISVRGGDFALAYTLDPSLIFVEWFITIGFVTNRSNTTLFSILSEKDDIFFIGNIINGSFGLYFHFRNDISMRSKSYIIEKKDVGYYLDDNRLHIIKAEFKKEYFYVTIDGKIFIHAIEEYTNEPTTFQNPIGFYAGGSPLTSATVGELVLYRIYPFVGCISGVKLIYQAKQSYLSVVVDPMYAFYTGSSMVQVGQISKNKCGKHNFTIGTNAPLIPYPPNPVAGDTSSVERRIPLGDSWGSTLLGLGIFIFILIILLVVFILKWWSRNIGTYQTEEGNIAKTGNVIGPLHKMPYSSGSEQSLIKLENNDVHATESGYI